jgi:hypothetical protein
MEPAIFLSAAKIGKYAVYTKGRSHFSNLTAIGKICQL